MNLAEITERQSRVVANIESLYPAMRSSKQPRPAGRPRRVDPAELSKVWTRFVERWQRGDWKLPRAESVHGLCRFSSVGGCLDPVFEGVVDTWFDPNAIPHHGNIVIAHLDPRALARIYECMAQNDAAIQAYGAQPVEPVVKLFATVGGQHWLVQRHGAVQLAGGRVLGVLKHVGPPPAHRIEWTNPDSKLWEVIEVWASTDNQWENAVKIAETKSNSFTMVRDAGEQRWFWVRAKRANGRVSKRAPDSDTSTVEATSGAIDTGNIEDEAVNVITTVTDDSVALASGGSHLVTALPDQGIDYTLQVTVTFDAWKNTTGTHEAYIFAQTQSGEEDGQPCEIFSTTSPGQRVTLQLELSVTTAMEVGSTNITVGIVHDADFSASPEPALECRNMTLRAVAIKR